MSIVALARNKVVRDAWWRPKSGLESVGAPEASTGSITDALTAVATYIPSEIIAVYTLVIAMVGRDGATDLLPLWAFYACLAAVPVFVWLLYAVQRVEAGEPLPLLPSSWPIWEVLSSLIAFTAWSGALPRSALLRFEGFTSPIAAILLVLVSLLLPLVGVLVTRKPPNDR